MIMALKGHCIIGLMCIGAVFDNREGERIANLVGDKRIAILQNHGVISLGKLSIDEAAWWWVPSYLIPTHCISLSVYFSR